MAELAMQSSGQDPVRPGRAEPSAAEKQKLADLFNQQRFPEVEALARALTTQYPHHGFGWRVLSLVLVQCGRPADALVPARQAVRLQPDLAEVHRHLAETLQQLGQLGEAAAIYGHSLAIRPDQVEVHTKLGSVLRQLGRLKDAEASFRRAIELAPDQAEVHSNLGATLKELGRLVEGEASCRKALQLKPNFADAHNNLGLILKTLGSVEEAAASFRAAIAIQPEHVEAWNNLGIALENSARLEEAEACYRHALVLRPKHPATHVNLGNLLLRLERMNDAEDSYRRALALNPEYAEPLNNLGTALFHSDRLVEAERLFRRALEIKPDFVEAFNNLSLTSNALGLAEEAVPPLRRALELKPDYAAAHSNLLLWLNYLPAVPAMEVFAEHRRWDERQIKRGPMMSLRVTDRDPQRRLRIGYVSPDLKQHSVAYFFEPLLREHDRSKYEVFCYAEVPRPDAMTTRLKALADGWLVTVGLSDAALARRIASDRIDILIDLAGHTAHNRLGVFALKPAPIQITWLGYPNTTGLRTMDYRLVDEITDPPGTAEAFCTERLIRLPNGFLCYAAPASAPEPAPRPSQGNDRITFGSFNNPAKLSARTLDAWSALLKRLPHAQLFLKGRAFQETAGLKAFLARLQTQGIPAERITLRSRTAGLADHLSFYSNVDIALDPFPYNGTTTTCEALWMGVPVVTLSGDRHAGRVGASLLTRVGLKELVANSVEDYVEIAARLAMDAERLAQYRRTTREKMRTSSLCDAPAFARQMEAAYRQIWREFCAGADSPESSDGPT